MLQQAHPKPRHLLIGAILAVGMAVFPGAASAAPSCQTSGPSGSSYAISVCLNQPADGSTLTGDTTVSGTTSPASGSVPGVQRLVFYVDGAYALTDYESPYTFNLPTDRWVDGTHRLEVEALLRDGFTSQRAAVNVTFSNGVTTPPVNARQWTPTSGTTPAPGKPFVLAAAGDGAGGEVGAQTVVDRIKSWTPNLFLYLGDVYEKGAPAEFKNWYGSPTSTSFGHFRSITNPVVGNHEYGVDAAAGYFDFWDNIPHYYSYNANGWHFIALDSTGPGQFAETTAGSPQYNWLAQDLRDNRQPCTIAYWHHPPFNIGPEGPSTRMDEMWNLLAQNGVAIALTGHDHDYQRWVPLDGQGNSSPDGITEFVAGTGGHSEQSFVGTDSRVASAFSNTKFGALRMELNPVGAAYQFVTADGTRLDSGSVQCPGTPADTTAPASPTDLNATAPSRQEVELSWNESTDNVGVTGYDIYRNGSLLKTVGPETSFHDGTVAPDTSYTYTVKAHDAAGNASQPTAGAGATTPPLGGVLFANGFEGSGLTPPWKNNGMTTAPSPVFSGSQSAHASNTGGQGATWVTRQLGAGQTNLYYQARVRVESQGTASPIDLMRFRSSASTPANLLTVMRTAAGKLTVRNETTSTTVAGAGLPTLSTGKWHTIQVHVLVNGAASQVEVWLDGGRVGPLSFQLSLGATPIGSIDLGEPSPSATRTYDMYFDDVAVDTNPIADVTAPSIPAALGANAASGLQVNLTWAPSTDDIAVTGYDIYRNGVLIASPTVASLSDPANPNFQDTTVGAQSSYFYQVRAHDGSQNASDLSDLVTVNTPAVFSDGFESGDMSRWDTSTGMTAVAGAAYSGGYAARATAFGAPADAVKLLAASPNELYYRIRFKIENSTGAVNLLRFRTAGDKSLYTVSVSSTGALAARNDNTSVTTQSLATITPGLWYELQVHLLVQGATGQTDVYLDGDPVPALSKVDDFGTTGIGKLELGDSTSHMFNALFDDVLVAANFIEDDTPPSAPTGLTWTTRAADQIALSWTPATDNIAVTSYDIYRDGALIHNVGASTTTYTDTSVESGQSYRYEVRANDKAGNTSDGSNQLVVATPGADTTPPTKPAGLTATAISPGEIDLNWNAATDDVGVTTYRIFRNGSLMTTVGGDRTSYQDKATSGDTTYSYTVEAADAAGNLSGQSTSASATTPHGAYFADGFEGGLAPNWTSPVGQTLGTVTAEPTAGATGSLAARAKTTSAAAWAWHALSSPQQELTYSLRFKSATTWSNNTTLLKMRDASAGPIFGIQVSSAGKLAVRNDSAARTISSQTVVSTAAWHPLEVHLVIAGAQSWYWVKLDGALVPGLSGTDDFGTAPVGRIQFGDNSGGKSYDVFFDDVEVQIPSAPPANVTRPAITGTAVDQETLAADTGGWTGTSSTSSFVYQWRDCDPSGSPCTDIPGATAGTYALRPSDIGKQIVVAVTATNGAGFQTASSNATATVAAAGPRSLSLPTITGAPVDGQQLSAAHGSWRGTPTINYAYQWQRCSTSGTNCTDISLATGDNYTLTPADVGSTIDVTVTATNSGGTSQAASTATNVIGGVAPTSTSVPVISGTTADGQTLSATHGTWGGTTPITYAYQWQRCDGSGANCADISSASATDYALTSADVGSTIVVNVTATNAGGSASAQSVATAPINPVAPANTVAPAISGSTQDGATLSADRGMWSGTTPISYAYQWQRCDSNGANCTDIGSANSSTYTLGTPDLGSRIAVRVKATNAGGATNATSVATAAVATAGPVNTSAPSITGAPTDGQQLTGSRGSWTGSAPIAYTYQWQRCDSSGAHCTDIGSATNNTYTLQGADIGSTVKFAVHASNGAGSAAATSPATNLVAAAAPANTSAPAIAGLARDGQTLTLDKGTWAGSDPINYTYQWQRCDAAGSNCRDIAGATGLNYTLTSDDVGSTIAATVAAANAGGSASAAAPVTSVVAGVAPTNTTAPSITGGLIDGQTLTADKGSWSGSTPIQYAYQWRDCDSSGTVCNDIQGATAASYVLQSSDVNKRIVVVVTATNSTGSAAGTSNATGTVSPVAPVNGVAPSVTGTTKAGSTLTADDGTWSGTTPINTTRQWQRCASDGTSCSDISSATGTTYVLGSNDVGQVLRAVVSAQNVGGTRTATSANTNVIQPADVPPQNVSPPTITGSAQDGNTLTAGNGSWTGTPPLGYHDQWRDCDSAGLNCTNIAGATSGTYVLRTSDVGSTIVVAVTASNDSGSVVAASSATATVAGTAPANATLPTISGNATVGATLGGDKGTWSGTTPINYSYQWQRCSTSCSDISGATAPSYTVQQNDFGQRLHLVVTATNAIGTSAATSSDTGAVAAAPWNTTAPSISGAPSDGSTLTANGGAWSGSDTITYSYQWQRCAADGTGCTDIAGETAQAHAAGGADVGQTLRVIVTAANSIGSATAHSDTTNVIAAAPPSNTTLPSISGTMLEGNTLTADKGSWSGTATITYAYQWRRCNNDGTGCADVAGATSNTYVLSTDDSNKAIKVRVTATNGAGSSSADSAIVVLRTSLFSDGFESGLAKWANFGLSTWQTNPFAGGWSARAFSNAGTASYATATVTPAQTDLTYRLHFRGNTTPWPSTGVYLLKLRTAASGAILGVYVNGSGKLSYKNDTLSTGGSFSTSTSVTSGVWNDLSVHVTIAGASSSIDMTLNGVHATNPARTDNFGTTPAGRILLGDNSTGRNFDVSADEVVVDSGG